MIEFLHSPRLLPPPSTSTARTWHVASSLSLTLTLCFKANDASACLADLARKGAAGTTCSIGANQYDSQMCRIGNAKVVGSKPASPAQGVSCSDVARTGGLIFDSCWRADGTVMGSEIVAANRQIQVNILAP